MPDVRVLIVDDEPDIRATVSAMLEIEGYEVDEAANGADALQVMERQEPDLILLDMRMPVLDGWAFAREMRSRGHVTPIVVMTAARDAARWASEIAAAAFVSKPFGFDDLILCMLARDLPVFSFPHDGLWLDIGRVEDFQKAQELAWDDQLPAYEQVVSVEQVAAE